MSGTKLPLIVSILIAICMISCGGETGIETEPEVEVEEVSDLACKVYAATDEIRIDCPDGTSAFFEHGIVGTNEIYDKPCVAVDNKDNTHTFKCDNGVEVVVKNINSVDGVVADSINISSPFQVAFLTDVSDISGTVIFDVPTISSLSLPSLKKVGGSVLLNELTHLEYLNLSELKTIDGTLALSRNTKLHKLEGLRALTSVKSLFISGNTSLSSLAGLESLVSVSGSLIIEESDGLKNLLGLDAVKSVGDLLQVRNNAKLTSLAGLNELVYIGDSFSINGNESLCQSSVDNWVMLLLNRGEVVGNRYASNNKDC